MRVCLLAVVALTAVALCSAADPECIYRKIRGLGMHWANPTDCSCFYRCTNKGVKREIVCDADKEYNWKTGKCAKRGRSQCPLSFEEPITHADNVCANEVGGAYMPQSTSCRDFYICSDGNAYPQSCSPGSYFNAAMASCQPDTDTTCWQNMCIGVTDGAFLADDTSCQSFFVCAQEQAERQSCGPGSYFNAVDKNCQPDADGQLCIDSLCVSKGDGAMVPDQSDCRAFYICSNGKPVAQNCPAGSYFDWTTNNCNPGDCPVSEDNCTCPGGIAKGAFVAHPGNCSLFYVCEDSALVLNDCGPGNYFNEAAGMCVRGQCPAAAMRSKRSAGAETVDLAETTVDSAQEEDTKNDEQQREEKSTDQDGENSCFGIYTDGQLINHPVSCHKFLLCYAGQLSEGECGIGNFFDHTTHTCQPDMTGECTVDREAVSEPLFPPPVGPAVAVAAAPAPAASDCTCPGGYSAGEKLPHPTDCNKYYICENGKLVLQLCQDGYRYDNCTQACIEDTDKSCCAGGDPEDDVCLNHANGILLPNPIVCSDYYICQKGVGVPQSCAYDQWFDPDLNACAPDTNAACLNPCVNIRGIDLLPHADCTKYYLCNDGTAHVETCPVGSFAPENKICSLNAFCPASMCQNQPDGTTFPSELSDTEFYYCQDNVAHLRSCELDSVYITDLQICLPLPTPDCNQTICQLGEQEGPFPTLNGTVNAFCFCRGAIAYKDFCPEDYTFNADRGVCYSSAPCDPDVCNDVPEYTITPNRNDTLSFCMCVMSENIIVDCPNAGTFHPTLGTNGLCQPTVKQNANCNASTCLAKPEFTIFAPITGDAGFCICMSQMGVYRTCPDETTFDVEYNACLTPQEQLACNVEACADGTVVTYPSQGDEYSFCYCQDPSTVIQMTCPNAEKFNGAIGICMPDYCDSNKCTSPADDNTVFGANNNTEAFCMCKDLVAMFIPCEADYMFDPAHLVCVPADQIQCDITKCAKAVNDNQYTVPAVGDPNGFCFCASSSAVQKYSCPADTVYDANLAICTAEGGSSTPGDDECTCPGGYKSGQMVAHPLNCQQYYLCLNSTLQLGDCTTGNYFNKATGACAADVQGQCAAVAATQCVGGYRQGDLIVHPGNPQLYFVCYDARLTVADCGPTNHFDARLAACVSSYAFSTHNPRRQRSAAFLVHDQSQSQSQSQQLQSQDDPRRPLCANNAKRSVPSNCTQFELCTNQTWSRRTCPELLYYNPEQQKCLEPLDDAVCAGARVTGLPPCNSANEQRTLPNKAGGSCAQYYRCAHGKWRLRSCPKPLLYARALQACVAGSYDEICTPIIATTLPAPTPPCQHTAVRHYAANCAMYLMCLEGEWWHQYCPLGMYFNRTNNYCVPNDAALCGDAEWPVSNSAPRPPLVPELSALNCSVEGALRPSALACDTYYVCVRGQWHPQECPAAHYFNVTADACLLDSGEVCRQLAASCAEGARRAYPLNCTAYEECRRGTWERAGCPPGHAFDVVLRQCVTNDGGACGSSGLRRACRRGEARPLPMGGNCTQFYYCAADRWQIGNCLAGQTFAPNDGNGGATTCVPHSATDKCQPLRLISGASSGADACVGREDGAAVPHPDDCSRFWLCAQGVASNEQQCTRGSFFDAGLGYCRPNDGRCAVPLTGACANATDGALLPHADDCRAYWHCSTVNGTQLEHCAAGEYYHTYTRQCRVDHGECQPPVAPGRCDGGRHGDRLPHERFCNIYYACVRGLAVPVECPDEHLFSAPLGRCVYDMDRQCGADGLLVDGDSGNATQSCGNLTDGAYLPDRSDCTRYYICTAGVALPKRCATGAFFEAQLLLCLPDDGSCPFVDDDQPNQHPVPPDPIVCEGKHGDLMPDPGNCNEFYVCVNGKLRHERCYPQHFFSATLYQCQQQAQSGNGPDSTEPPSSSDTTVAPQTTLARVLRVASSTTKTPPAAATAAVMATATIAPANATKTSTVLQCTDSPTSFADLCLAAAPGTSLAEQGDCRRYISCEDADAEPVSQRCRNGESYDSLLGFCRQNDGTCQLEDGQRVGVCNGRHGQLARDADNCRGYFVCINGQKIAAECAADEYFNRTLYTCQKDTTLQCGATATVKPEEVHAVMSCTGLSEAVLYPYVRDHCRSYFQCVKGVARVHECADGLYFDALSARCIREIAECVMPTAASLQRAPDAIQATASTTIATVTLGHAKELMCELGRSYAHPEDECRSYYVCQTNGTVAYTACPAGTRFSSERGSCAPAAEVICHL